LLLVIASSSIAQQEDSLTIEYNYINTIPQNAQIFINGEFAGNSPLFFKYSPIRNISIKLDGYAQIDYTPEAGENLLHKTFKMVPLTGVKEKEIVMKEKSFAFQKQIKIIPLIISSSVTAVSAIMAYYFKSLAIQKNDDYIITGDPALLDKKKKYDVIGGVSLAVFQAGLCALIYYHFID
jgi:hypothetical protein